MYETVKKVEGMLIHFPLSKAEMVRRKYGLAYRLSPSQAGLKNLQVVLIIVNPLKHTSKHYHPIEELYYFLSGSVTFVGNKQKFIVKPQDIVIVPPNEIHQIYNHSKKDQCMFIVAISPPRTPEIITYINSQPSEV